MSAVALPPCPFNAKCSYEYKAEAATEMSLVLGEVVSIQELNPNGWALASKKNGESGWVPLDFVDPVVEEEKAARPTHQKGESRAMTAEEARKQIHDAMSAAQRLAEMKCALCGKDIVDECVMSKDKTFHPACFQCDKCKGSLAGQGFVERVQEGKLFFYHEDCYYEKFNPPCAYCNEVIKGQYITALDQAWHPEHFVCAECGKGFEGNQFHKMDNKPYCEKDWNILFGSTCAKCGKPITGGKIFEALDKKFHAECFGNHAIPAGEPFHKYEEKIYCSAHFEQIFLQKCEDCKEYIKEEYIKIGEHHYHTHCWKCKKCNKMLQPGNVDNYQGKFYCKPCHATIISELPPTAKKVFMHENQPLKSAPSRPVQGQAPEAKKLPEGVEAVDELGNLYYSVSCLSKKTPDLPPTIDPTKKEKYLADDVFLKLFKMPKKEFYKLRLWRQKKMKRDVGLF